MIGDRTDADTREFLKTVAILTSPTLTHCTRFLQRRCVVHRKARVAQPHNGLSTRRNRRSTQASEVLGAPESTVALIGCRTITGGGRL